MARLREAEGDLGGAQELLEDAERVYVGDFSPNVRPVPAMRARVRAAQGRVDEALAWARKQQLSVADELTYFREFEHVTLARVLLAQSRAGRSEPPGLELVEFLDRLLAAAEAGGRTGTVIEVLVLQALTRQAGGEATQAHESIERALELAEDEGYARASAAPTSPVRSRSP